MSEYAIGIDLGGTNLKGIILSSDGTTEHLTRIPTEASRGGPHVLDNIVKLIGMLLDKHTKPEKILGVGFGTPGFIDADGTILGGAENIPGWKGINVYKPILETYKLPTFGGNDVTVTGLAESIFGAGKDVRNMICLALGTGIGGGIIINNHVYLGSHGMAGELGHICVAPEGLQCTCGQKGCVEQYASATGIVKNAEMLAARMAKEQPTEFSNLIERHPDKLSAKMVYDFAKRGDTIALEVNDFICHKLSRAIGILANTFAPDRFVLGGGVMQAGTIILDTVKKYTPLYCWPAIWERCDIVAAQCGENAGVLGAASLVFERK